MTREEILKTICSYLEEYFEVESSDIKLESKLVEDLDLDSIDAVDLIVKLQDITKQKISPESFKQVRTVEDVVEKVYAIVHK